MFNKIQLTVFTLLFFCLLSGYFSDPLRFKRFPLTPSFHCKRKDKASQSSSGCPMREAKNPQLEMAKQPQIKRRIQANMSLFHFISLAEQSSHSNGRQAAVCFPKSKPKTTPKRVHYFSPRHWTFENPLGNPASSTN